MRRAFLLLGALFLAGCAADVMNSYVGKDITAAMVDYGPPAASFELPDGRSAFQWRMAYGVPIPSTTTYTGTTWGGTTTGNAVTSGGGMMTGECLYTLYAKEGPAGRFTVTGYEPPSWDCA